MKTTEDYINEESERYAHLVDPAAFRKAARRMIRQYDAVVKGNGGPVEMTDSESESEDEVVSRKAGDKTDPNVSQSSEPVAKASPSTTNVSSAGESGSSIFRAVVPRGSKRPLNWMEQTNGGEKENPSESSETIDISSEDDEAGSVMPPSKQAKTTPAKRRFPCSQCTQTFMYKWNLDDHLKRHAGRKDHLCEICSKAFVSTSALKDHLKRHRGEKNHKCDICGKAFVSTSALKDHLKRHRGEKDHKCDICGKAFVSTSALKDHLKRHRGEKDHQCNQCDKSFVSSTGLKNHLEVHSNEQPYKCKHCGRSFHLKSSYRRHCRDQH